MEGNFLKFPLISLSSFSSLFLLLNLPIVDDLNIVKFSKGMISSFTLKDLFKLSSSESKPFLINSKHCLPITQNFRFILLHVKVPVLSENI